jgi:hypothetical protein
MKGDFTRFTFNPRKHYSSVRMQQGRVQLDSDSNEFVDIMLHRDRTMTRDLIGGSGGPEDDAGFKLICHPSNASTTLEKEFLEQHNVDFKSGDFVIGKGRYYINGLLCESDFVTFFNQPDMLDIDIPKIKDNGRYLAFLDVWERHITSIEDPDIREVALGGPDTTTRTKTVWQVKLLEIDEALSNSPCVQEFKAWNDLIAERQSLMAARVNTEKPSTGLCILPSGGGYTGLTNQLYRVEIHSGNENGQKATFKWSKDNGSVVRAIRGIDGSRLILENTDQDLRQAFARNPWVEVTDDWRELNEKPGTLVSVESVDVDALIISDLGQVGDPVNSDNFPEKRNDRLNHPKVRRWDQTSLAETEVESSWTPLDLEVEVYFNKGDAYRTGDYWMIPARAGVDTEHQIEWEAGQGKMMQRFGVEHQYCRLAVLERANGDWKGLGDLNYCGDCRVQFPSAVDLYNKLEELNRKPGGGCMIIVGPVEAGGQYPRLDKAIRKLMKDPNLHDIGICLLPGDHELPNGLEIVDRENPSRLNIKIIGCSGSVRLRSMKRILVDNLHSFSLCGLDMEFGTDEQEALIFRNCHYVSLDSCSLSRWVKSGSILGISGCDRVIIERNNLKIYNTSVFDLHQSIMSANETLKKLFSLHDRDMFVIQAVSAAKDLELLDGIARSSLSDAIEKAVDANEKNIHSLKLTPSEQGCYKKLNAKLDGGRVPISMAKILVDLFDRAVDNAVLEHPLTAITIMDGKGNVTISDNKLAGMISLYGGHFDPNPNLLKIDLPAVIWAIKGLFSGNLSDKRPIGFGNLNGSLWVRGNHFTGIHFGIEFSRKLFDWFVSNETKGLLMDEVFRSIYFTDNLVETGWNRWVAKEVRLSGNSFQRDEKNMIGEVTALNTIFNGNSVPAKESSDEAVNVEGETIKLVVIQKMGSADSSNWGFKFDFVNWSRSSK